MISPWNSRALKIGFIVSALGLFHHADSAIIALPQDSPAKPITIADGTPVHLYLMDDLNSKKNKEGDVVRFKVREGIRVGTTEVIAEGSEAIGHVVAAAHTRLGGHSGKLGLSIDYAVAVNGSKVHLRGEATVKGGSRGATMWESAAWFGPEASIHKGTMLNAYVDGSQTVSL